MYVCVCVGACVCVLYADDKNDDDDDDDDDVDNDDYGYIVDKSDDNGDDYDDVGGDDDDAGVNISVQLHSDGEDGGNGGRHLRPLLAAPAQHHPHRRRPPGHLDVREHSDGLDLLPLDRDEQLLLQSDRLLLDEQQLPQRVPSRPALRSMHDVPPVNAIAPASGRRLRKLLSNEPAWSDCPLLFRFSER